MNTGCLGLGMRRINRNTEYYLRLTANTERWRMRRNTECLTRRRNTECMRMRITNSTGCLWMRIFNRSTTGCLRMRGVFWICHACL